VIASEVGAKSWYRIVVSTRRRGTSITVMVLFTKKVTGPFSRSSPWLATYSLVPSGETWMSPGLRPTRTVPTIR
jgi:hypothetical protein